MRALNRSSSNVNVGGSSAAAKIKGAPLGGASTATASEVIAITDNNNSASVGVTLTPHADYDADLSCSALESPKKVNKVS